MNLIFILINQAYAVGYIPKEPNPVSLPFFPSLITLEQIILSVLFFTLMIPLFKNQKDKNFEKFRFKILKLSSFTGALLLAVHFYRRISGH